MSRKLLWTDLETTGLDDKNNSIIELAAIYIDMDKESEPEVFHQYCHYASYPDNFDEIEKLTGITREHLAEVGVTEMQLYQRFTAFLSNKVDRYNKSDKIIIAGYNVKSFDSQFLRTLWNRNNDKYYGSFFESVCLDVMSRVAEAKVDGKIAGIPNNKLSTVCEYFGIDFDAHSAISDVKATKKLYEVIKESYER